MHVDFTLLRDAIKVFRARFDWYRSVFITVLLILQSGPSSSLLDPTKPSEDIGYICMTGRCDFQMSSCALRIGATLEFEDSGNRATQHYPGQAIDIRVLMTDRVIIGIKLRLNPA
ncbi:hypothetical protein F4604DRAFT_1779915 [Suillus subluteus]|nr:hypothetical protein F4604DRAFT_1779915 [Suillus subluteus]